MALDTVTADLGTGGAVFRTDKDGSNYHYPFSKIVFGAAGTYTLVSTSNGFPVAQQGTWTVALATDVAVAEAGALGKGVLVQGDDGTDRHNLQTDASGYLKTSIQAIVPGTAATALGKAEDAAHTSGDVGVMMLSVRQDAAAALGGTDADYQPLVTDANGRLHVLDANSANALTALQLLDNAVYVDDADWTDSTSSHILVGGLYQSSPQTVTDGDVAPIEVDVNGKIIESNSASIKTAVELIDNSVVVLGTATYTEATSSGLVAAAVRNDTLAALANTDNELAPFQVNATGALYVVLSTGAAAIGKLAANTGVDIGDVDVTSIVPGAGATNLGKAEDAVHSSGDVGVMMLGVRQDAQVDFGADGDYVTLSIDANGALRVAGGGGGTQYTEDDAVPGNPVGTAMLMERDDALGGITPAAGDWSHPFCDADGALWVSISSGSSSGTEYTEDDAVPANPIGTAMMMERDDALGGLTPAAGDWTHPFCDANGALWTILSGSLPDTAATDLASITTNTGAISATISQQASAASLSVVPANDIADATYIGDIKFGEALPANTNTQEIVGDAAHDAAVAGNPVLTGAYAANADPTAVANGDAVRLIADLVGRLITSPHCSPEKLANGTTAFAEYTDNSDHVILTNPDGGERYYITHFSAMNAHATVDTAVQLEDQDGTVLAVIWCENSGGGASLTFDPPLRCANVDKDIEVQCETTGAAVYVNVTGFLGR